MLKHYQYKLVRSSFLEFLSVCSLISLPQVSYHHSKEEANEELLQVLQHVKKYEQVTPKTDPFYKYVAVTVHEVPISISLFPSNNFSAPLNILRSKLMEMFRKYHIKGWCPFINV